MRSTAAKAAFLDEKFDLSERRAAIDLCYISCPEILSTQRKNHTLLRCVDSVGFIWCIRCIGFICCFLSRSIPIWLDKFCLDGFDPLPYIRFRTIIRTFKRFFVFPVSIALVNLLEFARSKRLLKEFLLKPLNVLKH